MLQSNEYFDGKVKSIGFTSSSTGSASVGVMAEGEYTFGTAQPEEMTVINLLSVPLSVSQRDARRLPPGCFFLPARQEGKRRLALRFAAEPFHQALDQGSQLAGH